jgi:hypothetical protein
MNRRNFIELSTYCLLFVSSNASADVSTINGEQYLDTVWVLPRNTVIELWSSRLKKSLNDILKSIDEWTIPGDSHVNIRFDDGLYIYEHSVEIQYQYGKRISIIGNVAHPERCRFEWKGSKDGIYVNAGYVLGLIDGITFQHIDKPNRGSGSAFLADNGGIIFCGKSVIVNDFYYGFQARFGGIIQCSETTCSGGGDANYFAFNGGHISAPSSKSYHANDEEKHLGSGYVAEYGGTINAIGAVSEYNALAGFTALSKGSIRAYKSHASHNIKAGYYVNTGGVIVAHDAVAESNCGVGVLRGSANEIFEANNFIEKNNSLDLKQCRGVHK